MLSYVIVNVVSIIMTAVLGGRGYKEKEEEGAYREVMRLGRWIGLVGLVLALIGGEIVYPWCFAMIAWSLGTMVLVPSAIIFGGLWGVPPLLVAIGFWLVMPTLLGLYITGVL